MILFATAMLMCGAACYAQEDIKTNSEKAANQAKQGNAAGAANTASKTWQNDGFSKSTPGSSNLNDIVSKKAEEARTAASKGTETKSEPKPASGSSNGSSSSANKAGSGTANSGSKTEPKEKKSK